jgi:CheY-like chemotaxis protein/anti-sigma regulatory factor (Ser/Thr protein kinase)
LIDICEIVNEVADQTFPLFKRRSQKLSKNLSNEPIFVNGDAIRLRQVFTTLLTNASKYTDEKGSIWLTIRRSGHHVEIVVCDNGMGIDTKYLSKVFEPFAQAEQALTRSQGGLGLGLPLVKGLIENHGGTVFVTSEGTGTGSCFTVRLPTTECVPTEQRVAPIKDSDLTGKRVLVVDDNADAAISMQMMLAMDGCEVMVATDGEEALSLFDTLQPDAVLLDIGLPKLNGREVARRIREKNKHVVLIAVSGYGTPADLVLSKEAGINHHVVKPVEPNGFKQLLSAALDNYEQDLHVGIHN